MNLLKSLSVLTLCGVTGLGLYRFSKANAELVKVDLLFAGAKEYPIWVALLVAFLIGALLIGLILLIAIVKQGLTSRGFRKKAEKLEAEIDQLRISPLAEHNSGKASDVEMPSVYSDKVRPQRPEGF